MVPTAAIRDLQDKVAALAVRLDIIEAMLSSPPIAEDVMTYEPPRKRRRRRTKSEIEADINAAFSSALKKSGYQDNNEQDNPENTGDTEDADQP